MSVPLCILLLVWCGALFNVVIVMSIVVDITFMDVESSLSLYVCSFMYSTSGVVSGVRTCSMYSM